MFERKARAIGTRLRNACARMALRCTNTTLVSRRLMRAHERAKMLHGDGSSHLTDLDRKIVEGLGRDGIYVTTLAALGLPDGGDLLASGMALGKTFAPDARRQSQRGRDYTMVPPAAVASHPDIFAWGLNERLLDIVEAYLGVRAGYDGVTLTYTVAGAKVAGPRRWHRDWEDRRVIKVGIYCNDVLPGGGPFQMIRRRDSTHGGANGYHYDLADNAMLGERLGADYRDDLISCEGPAGTVIFCETAQHFHRGEPAQRTDRIAYFFSYFARRPRHPFYCERSGLSRRQIAILSEPLNQRQRESALWRRGLPLLLRFLPSASL